MHCFGNCVSVPAQVNVSSLSADLIKYIYGVMAMVKSFKSWHFDRQPFVRAS